MVLILLSLISCNRDNVINSNTPLPVAKERIDIQLTNTQAQYIIKGNELSLKLLNDIIKANPGKSIVFSPLSIEYLLAMLANGADGTTLDEIKGFLGFSDIDELNSFYKTLFDQLPNTDNTVRLSLANAIIVNSDFATLKDSFKYTVHNYYDALIRDFSFAHKGDSVLNYINSWAKENTNNGIDQILGDINPSIHSILLNALYFKANWNSTIKFNNNNTINKIFTNENNKKYSVKFMHCESKIGVHGNENYMAIRLPYGNGAFCMDIILPDDGYKVVDISTKMVSEGAPYFTHLMNVVLDLPRFTTEDRIDLVSIMTNYIPSAFFPCADFSRMTQDLVYIDAFFQKAKIDVNEDGTESSAVTVVSLIGTSPLNSNNQNSTLVFNANHPFIYLIRETSTNAIITMGVYNGNSLS